MAADTDKSWDDILKESEFLITEEPTFLEEAEENIEELAYGFEKSRWLAGNAARYVMAGGDEDVLKKQEAERLAEIEGKYDLSEERKQSGFALTGEIGGTLLDPSAIALGYAGVAAKAGQAVRLADRASNALVTGTVAGGDYALSELAAGEKVDPVVLAISGLGVGALGAAFTKTKKAGSTVTDEVAEEVTESTDYLSPIGPVPDNKVDAYIDKLTYSFNNANPSRLQVLKDTQTNGQKLGTASQVQKVYRLESARRASPKKKNRYTDAQFERLSILNNEASEYLKDSGNMLARQAEVIGEGISGVAGRLKEEGTFNANMIRRAVYRPMIGAVGGVGLGYSVSWASDEEIEPDEIMYYALAGMIGGAASKAIMKSNKLSDQDIDMATGEINKIIKSNSLSMLNNLAAGSSAAKANAFGGRVATIGKTLFAQRGANLRGAASTSVEENKDLVLQELNTSWSRVLSDSNVAKKDGLLNLFSADAKGLREAAYEYSEGFVNAASLSKRGFSDDEIATIVNLSEEATSRVGALTEEVISTGIKMRGKVKDYKLPQFHDINKIVNNEQEARKAYKKAYRIQANALTPEKQARADKYIDDWIDDMLEGGINTKHTSAYDGKGVFRPLTDHFEKPRMFKDFNARLEIKDFLVKDIDQVYRQYVDNTVPIMEFARKFGAKGEGLTAVKKEITTNFETVLARADLKQRKKLKATMQSQLDAIDEMTNDYFGFIDAGNKLAKSPLAQNISSIFVTGANVARLGKVTITSVADLAQPFQNSGVFASLKALARQKDFAKETGFAQRDVLGDELRQYALEVSSPGSKIQRSSRWINEQFFKKIGLTKLTSYARKFAYNSGVERGFVVANKMSKGGGGTGLRNEANSLGITDEYASILSRFDSVEDAFKDVDGNRILNIIGVKSADRDALIPQIGNRRAFSKSNDPFVRGLGQFLSWAQAKTTQTNSLITRMEDGHDILFVRMLGAIAVVNGIETFKSLLSDPTGADLEIDQQTYFDQYATLKNIGKASGRTGNFNHYLIDKVAQLASSGGRAELDDIWPALDWATDLYKTGIGVAGDIQYGDTEGAIVKSLKVAPMGREIKSAVEAVTGERYVDEPNRKSKPYKLPNYDKGGEVLDVPNTAPEPDERIDKMTGMPYNQQAGTAFTDVEDREDPLQRLGFGSGGEVDPLQRMGFSVGGLFKMGIKAFKSLDDEAVEELPMKNTDELVEESKQIAKAVDAGEPDAALKANSASKTTQRANTIGTATKASSYLDLLGAKGRSLDYGAGKGLNAKANKIDDTFEPFPEQDFNPTFMSPSEIPKNKYGKIISTNVINVLPPGLREEAVFNIGNALKVGGKALIQTWDAGAAKAGMASKKATIVKEEPLAFTTSTGSYQKGFTKEELSKYVTDVLGDSFEVLTVPNKQGISGVSVVITKIRKRNNKGGKVLNSLRSKLNNV